VDLASSLQFDEAASHVKRAIADNIRAEECRRISLELAATTDEFADQWDAIDLTIVGYIGVQAVANNLRPRAP